MVGSLRWNNIYLFFFISCFVLILLIMPSEKSIEIPVAIRDCQ